MVHQKTKQYNHATELKCLGPKGLYKYFIQHQMAKGKTGLIDHIVT